MNQILVFFQGNKRSASILVFILVSFSQACESEPRGSQDAAQEDLVIPDQRDDETAPDIQPEGDIAEDPVGDLPGDPVEDSGFDMDAADMAVEDTVAPDGYPEGMGPVLCGGAPCVWTDCCEPLPEGDPVTVSLVLADFLGYSVGNAYVDVFLDNLVSDTPDFELGPTSTSGQSSEFQARAFSLLACRTHASSEIPFPPGEIKTTIHYSISVPETGGGLAAVVFTRQTQFFITVLLDFPESPDRGMLVGSLADCTGEPVEGVVARLYPYGSSTDCRGESTFLCSDGYFIDSNPSMEQLWSSEDGLFVILEIPPGEGYTLQLHGLVSGSSCPEGMQVLGEALDIAIMPDTIGFINLSADVADEERCVF